jgi:DDE superfamily endonuclease
VRLVRRWPPEREIVVVGDQTYAALEWLDAVRHAVCVITRLRLDAALYEPAPPCQPRQNGRPRKKGKRLPPLEKALTDSTMHWTTVPVANWYGERARCVQITSATAVWYHSGKPVVPIRWVLIRDPEGHFEPHALLTTNQKLTPVQVLTYFIRRWHMEVCQTQPVNMTWWPLRNVSRAMTSLRGEHQRERIVNINLLSRDDNFAQQALGNGLAFFTREPAQMVA